MKFNRFCLLLMLSCYLFSCKTPHKIPFYLDKVDSTGKGQVQIPEMRIRPGDLLSIQIASIANPKMEVDAMWNQPINANAAQAALTSGYLVNESGKIIHHRLGEIHADGLTKKELAAEIRKRLVEPVQLLKDPTVEVRLLNFRITVLGEVGRAGVIDIPTEKVNIFQAIGLAGGIPDEGKRDQVKVVREINGQREVGYIDLTSKNVFESPYYYLVQNDMLFVEPTKRKLRDEDQVRTFQKISYAFTLVTVAATIANIFIR